MPVQVVTDSTASLPRDLAEEFCVRSAPLYVIQDGVACADDEIEEQSFYWRLASLDSLPGTSQASVEEITRLFREAVASGADVLGVFVSELMSGTLQAARLASAAVREEFPRAVIELVDSRSNSMQEGFAVLAGAAAAKAGASVGECAHACRDTMRRTRYLFTPATLEYLRRGGRIGAASALLGNLLQIRPVLTVENGVTDSFARVRTQGRALAAIADTFTQEVAEKGLRRVVVHYIADRPAAEEFARRLIEPVAKAPVRVLPVAPTIGIHVGPAVGIVYETVEPLRAQV